MNPFADDADHKTTSGTDRQSLLSATDGPLSASSSWRHSSHSGRDGRNSPLQSTYEMASSKEEDAKRDRQSVVSEAPPPYFPPESKSNHTSAEDPLQLLRNFNTVIVLDDSSSMSASFYQLPGSYEKITLWKEAKNALVNLAVKAAEYDEDGIDIHFLNNTKVGLNLKTREEVEKTFEGVNTQNGTPIAARLDTVIREYMEEYAKWQKPSTNFFGKKKAKKPLKKLNVLVITDGYPTDEPKQVIADLVRDMERLGMEYNRVGIQFVQIGNSSSARRYLEELDGDTRDDSALRDIVDTTQYAAGPLDASPETIVKILLGGIHRRIDSQGAHAVMPESKDADRKFEGHRRTWFGTNK